MKFQIPNIHHSKVNTHTHTHTHTQTDRQTDKPKAICPSNFFKVGGIMIINQEMFVRSFELMLKTSQSTVIVMSGRCLDYPL